MMPVESDLSIWLASTVLLSLRIAPVFALAPPFTLTRVPKLFTALFGMGLAVTLASANPIAARVPDLATATLVIGGLRELALGLAPVVVLEMFFAALYMVGRTIDIQSGYGLALLIDPTTRGQAPLVGTLLAYLAGAMFFAMDGHHTLLKFFVASLDLVPLGAAHMTPLAPLLGYIAAIMLAAFGVGGLTILALFLTDLTIAMLSRTVPQMNALLLGIQVKAIMLFLVLPIVVSVSGVLLMAMVTRALETMARLI